MTAPDPPAVWLSPTEEWREIEGFEYQVSDRGRVRSVDRIVVKSNGHIQLYKGRVLRQFTRPRGDLRVDLFRAGRRRPALVHVLVCTAWHGPRPPGHEVCHQDDDAANNVPANLRWGTRSDNLHDSVRNGRHHQTRKSHCPLGHVLAEPNLIPSLLGRTGQRGCLACSRARSYCRATLRSSVFAQQVADRYYEQILQAAAALIRPAAPEEPT